MRYKKVVIDIETTRMDFYKDEVLRVSVIDDMENILLNEYCKPTKIKEWKESEAIHGITPDKVKTKKTFVDYVEELSDILTNAEVIIVYNASFVVSF